ncbi:MAG: hypothetical protein V4683_12675 [Bacteroidota bacterium]
MKYISKSFVTLLFTFFLQQITYAQATRTWVSGVGDDANPCSRTAPCKTFAGAISKTAAGGEINALDPGGFGGVTITKSIIISAIGVEGGILISGTSAIIINAAATDLIVLKGLDIEGLANGTSTNGINILSAQSVLVEDCTINGFNAAATGNGINVSPAANPVKVIVQNTRISNCTKGINVAPSGAVVADVNLLGILIGLNVTGINSTGTGATVRLSNSSLFNNTTAVSNSTGKVISFGNNNFGGNTNSNAITVTEQQ